ncbi:mxaD protein [Methylomarinovum caldicuralii]|uniref:MxaD protein n=1 Tax=Methylomarinovum caldicuralii TaxID=438856 RepID=A0AAU9BY84_9GAMM|nr:SRPBCC family protein [Methylomarinovum caldicuralii]BCX81017.1 mxaD protein [Methylomarinovum caldicuralii]
MRKLIPLFSLLALVWAVSTEAHGPSRQKVAEEVVIDAPAAKVWEIVKDFCSLEKWHPQVKACTLEGDGTKKGAKRKVTLAGGGWMVEELKKYDPKKRMYKTFCGCTPDEEISTAKTITWSGAEVKVPVIPVANYSSIFEVKEADGKTKVVWRGAFYRAYMNNNPPPEMNEEAAIKAVTEFYRQGLDHLKQIAESQ